MPTPQLTPGEKKLVSQEMWLNKAFLERLFCLCLSSFYECVLRLMLVDQGHLGTLYTFTLESRLFIPHLALYQFAELFRKLNFVPHIQPPAVVEISKYIYSTTVKVRSTKLNKSMSAVLHYEYLQVYLVQYSPILDFL